MVPIVEGPDVIDKLLHDDRIKSRGIERQSVRLMRRESQRAIGADCGASPGFSGIFAGTYQRGAAPANALSTLRQPLTNWEADQIVLDRVQTAGENKPWTVSKPVVQELKAH